MESRATVGHLGEEGLLALIAREAGSPLPGEVWSGDDAAVLSPETSSQLLATDFMLEGVDFELTYATGADIGWKAMAINASDIAAMGGTPTRALASAALPEDLPSQFFEALLDGLHNAARAWSAPLVGGDLGRGDKVMVSVAMLGRLEREPVLRSGIQPGDAICVTGTLGASAGGLLALRQGLRDRSKGIDELIGRHLRPHARVDEGQILARFGATGMIDISDGFGLDLSRCLRASGVGCDVTSSELPLAAGLTELCEALGGEADPLGLALSGGEDYELLVTISPAEVPHATEALAELGTQLTEVGRAQEGAALLDSSLLSDREELGWDHLQGR